MKKNTKKKEPIPTGIYCYSGSCAPGSKTFKICPYWEKMDDRPEQENGYCKYLRKGDWEINREEQTIIETSHDEDNTEVKREIKCGPDNPSFMSLLWDMCKDPDCPKYNLDEEIEEAMGLEENK